jgi:WD40 repeat protein
VLPLLPVSSSRANDFTPGRDSLYVSDESGLPFNPPTFLGTVSNFKASNGILQGVLINALVGGTATPGYPGGFCFTPNGIVVSPVSPPQLVVANQNICDGNGEIKAFDEATGAFKSVLVPATNGNAPLAPFAILLYQGELLIADEGPPGHVEAFDATHTPATFLQNLDITGYPNASYFHPFGMVVGPHGKLYVATRSFTVGVPGDVIQFDLSTGEFDRVFVSGTGCGCNLDDPSGVVFGPDGRLYVTSSRPATGAPSDDTDKILIFDGTTGKFLDKIDLDMPGAILRSAAPGLLFGPQGLLYVTIVQLNSIGVATGVGSVRRYNVASKQYHDMVPPNTNLALPTLFTFDGTNPATLAYEN